jgi:hypothetical protein
LLQHHSCKVILELHGDDAHEVLHQPSSASSLSPSLVPSGATHVWSPSAWTYWSWGHVRPSHSPHPHHCRQSHTLLSVVTTDSNFKPITSSTSSIGISNWSINPSQVEMNMWCKCFFLYVLHIYKMRSMSENAYAQTRVWPLLAWTLCSCGHVHPSYSVVPHHSLQSHNSLHSHHRQQNLKPITSSTSFANISNCSPNPSQVEMDNDVNVSFFMYYILKQNEIREWDCLSTTSN